MIKPHKQIHWRLWIPWVGAAVLVVPVFLYFFPVSQPLLPADEQVKIEKDPHWLEMEEVLSQYVKRYDGVVGLYIKDLKSGAVFERNADDYFICASLIKLPIMVATFEAIQKGMLSLNTPVKYTRNFKRGGSGRIKWVHPGTVFTLVQLIYHSITESDNTATAMLVDKLGYEYMNQRFESMGLKATRINQSGMSLASSLDPSKDNYTTPREMGQLLEKIYRHDVVEGPLSEMMLEIMKRADSRGRLAKYLPSRWHFARKTGLLRNNCHDVGIVFTPHGDYIFCVLTGHNANYTRAKNFIASIGRRAYSYFGNS